MPGRPRRTKEPTTEFGWLLSRLRAGQGVSLRELAGRLGYAPSSYPNLQKYESGELLPPEPKVILHITEALGYTIEDEQTKQLLLAALADHIREVYPSFQWS